MFEKDIHVLYVNELQEAKRVFAQYTTPKRYELSDKPKRNLWSGKSLDEAIAKIKWKEELKKEVLDEFLQENPEVLEMIREKKLAKADALRKTKELAEKTFRIKPKAIDLLDLKKEHANIEVSHVKEAIQKYAASHPKIASPDKIVDIKKMQTNLGITGKENDGVVGRQTYNLLVENLRV